MDLPLSIQDCSSLLSPSPRVQSARARPCTDRATQGVPASRVLDEFSLVDRRAAQRQEGGAQRTTPSTMRKSRHLLKLVIEV